jgi:hypothetical protein
MSTSKKVGSKRREFIKHVALGSIALTSLPTLLTALPASADDDEGKTVYQFLNVSDGKAGLSKKSIFMNGVGKFGSGVTGGGNYVIFDNTHFTLSDFGSWRAKKFVSFTHVGAVVGGALGGTLTMDVILKSASGGEANATVTVNCDGGVISPNGGNGSGDVATLVIKNGTFAGTFGPGSSVGPFNVTIFFAASD